MTTFSNASVSFPAYAPGFTPIENLPALRRIISYQIAAGAHVVLDGAILPGDGAGGLYVWIGTLVAADDSASTIKPDDLGPAQPGRWVALSLKGVTGQSLTLTEVAASTIANPSAGRQVIYIDAADHKLKRKDFLGNVTTLG